MKVWLVEDTVDFCVVHVFATRELAKAFVDPRNAQARRDWGKHELYVILEKDVLAEVPEGVTA